MKAWARGIKRDALTVWLASRDPRTSWWVKALAVAVAAYAFSPIDLIPDFIPVLGYLDDLLIVPAGLWLVLKLIPTEVLETHRATAEAAANQPVSLTAAAAVVGVWIVVATVAGCWIVRVAGPLR